MRKPQMRRLSLHLRTVLVVLPLLIGASLAGTILSYDSSRRTIDQQASEFLAYRTAQLKDYLENQWLLLANLGLQDSDIYRQLAQDAATDYAEGLIRGAEEVVFVRDDAGKPFVLAEGPGAENRNIDALATSPEAVQAVADGYSGFLRVSGPRGDSVVAVTFPFEPFGWQVFFAERESSLYGRSRQLLEGHLWILVGTTIFGALAMLWVTYRILGPIRTVAVGMEEIARNRSFARRVPVEYNDEVGLLAHRFNQMNESLETAYQRMRDFATSETVARQDVIAREHETLEVLGRATDYKDPETGAHIVRVGLYSEMLARRLGESEERCTLIRHAAPLHDIGKLGIPDRILLKPGRLSDEEYEVMKRHTLMAYEILKGSKSEYLKAGAEIALSHHERYDGSGYPYGLVGEEIPLFGRIVGLVDVFDALVSLRPYKPEWSVDAALTEISAGKDTLFDARIVDLFVAERERIIEILETYREDYVEPRSYGDDEGKSRRSR